MKRLLHIFFALFFLNGQAIADEKWINIAQSNDKSTWEIKPKSLEFTRTKGGTEIAVVIGRII